MNWMRRLYFTARFAPLSSTRKMNGDNSANLLRNVKRSIPWEYVDSVEETLQEEVVHHIRLGNLYSIMLDMTNDSEDWLSLIFRLVKEGEIRHVFYGLTKLPEASAESLVNIVKTCLKDSKLDWNKLVGVATDSCSVKDLKSTQHD